MPASPSLALLHLRQSFSIDNYSSWYCDFNDITSYPKTKSWKKGSDCCSWDGVTCDWVTNHVIELDLSCSWLFDTIHSNTTLFLLPHLQRINLAFNNFNGSSISASGGLPTSIDNLKSLQTLDLVDCEFSRSIPASLENLTQITFFGQLPPSIGNLTNLQDLDFSNNQLEGVIPSHLDLSHNKLTGHIVLSLYSNNFSGILETNKFGNLRNLTQLDLSNNMLSLTTSDNSKSMLPNIQRLDLSNNKISGVWSWNMGNDAM
ncbi:Receptor-like protein 12 [Vitis vinifera]|uniref:Receptor-like protein 12 n=1 Tax=Vitis vinifera TaxID=29760 RepID=A0A438GRW6_VITVI|nr:Receptor-like protein 12 [Vitis vinifera]